VFISINILFTLANNLLIHLLEAIQIR